MASETKNKTEDDAAEKQRLEKELDKALKDSFPGSDPVAITQPTKNTPAKGRD